MDTYFRLLQMLPSFSPEHYDIEWELPGPEHGIFTVTRCKFLEEMEKAGQGFERLICGESEPRSFQMLAKEVSPRMVARPLKLPPMKSRDEIACQFEFRIEPAA